MAKRCLGCMKIKENSPICEHCGYNENVPNYPNQLPVGMLLHGQYTVGKVLGQGGFGITYIGWDNSLETVVAIKEFYPSGVVNRDTQYSQTVSCNGKEAEVQFGRNRERFLKEARILAKLQNVPGVVRVQNLFSENNTVYIVMEYVQGIDLRQYLRMHNRSMTAKEVLTILRPVLYALHKVHGAGLIHRDIAPDNIMILPDGTAKLLDFGAAREVEPGQGMMESTEAILKHGFAPIEQYSRRGNLGPWTDVYALCATIYYCLTGKLPDSAAERVMGEDNVDWRNIPDLTDKQIQILEKGMALRPEDRIQSMEELYHGLFPQQQAPAPKPEPVQPQQPAVASKSEKKQAPQPKSEKKQTSQPKQKKRALPVIAAAAVVAIAAAAILLLPKSNAEKPAIAVPEMTLPAVMETTAPVETTMAVETIDAETQRCYDEAVALEESGKKAEAAIAFGKLAGYADARERSMALWEDLPRNTFAVSGGKAIALKKDGSVVLAFTPTEDEAELELQRSKQVIVSGWTDIVSVSFGQNICYGLKCDGTVVSVEDSRTTEWQDILRLPEDASFGAVDAHGFIIGMSDERGIMDKWTDIVMVANENCVRVGLKSDGTVVGNGPCGYCRAGIVAGWNNVVAVYGYDHTIVGLRADGTVLITGGNGPQRNVKSWKDIIAVCVDSWNAVGLKSDGTVVTAGTDTDVHRTVAEWSDIVAIDTAGFIAGLRSDGTLVVSGWEDQIPEGLPEWTDIQIP